MTDRELIDNVRAGDSQAFEQLVKRYESQVAATVIGMLGSCQEADDVGQEVFIRFYKAIHQFREEARLGTYLTRIAINLSLNELKRRKRRHLLFKRPEKVKPMMNPDDS
ncbi:sigma-70 family RNA polymerase sigma factor, partial [candidate division KSB1 bacterium]|nr:sigma-70 family RNA polymerase sigma factor [candidate division KSB1 bacterium]NIR70049.1 sigma-70 family RNA polymerase sigma factor [candidate division KSB1 bacterium]NIS23043.1 sigma-70 family RNA polymerase sigma factor [candidate division KSB1 bacterium]NIT69896.1 sigma-70 family RNA polymerase sigma factor [candidate division KSB1 bacterium]NIU23561.1 sigma-70 family RNA polymerase sigma factor [candidate division KSB1 bacterium]